jgi:ABC-type phosphate transport system ATPase subunit
MQASRIAQRTMVLEAGKVVSMGPTAEILNVADSD